MPRRKVFDKKTATTFSLVHRAQNDPLIHDENAPSMVFAERAGPSRAPQEDDYPYSDTGSIISGTSSYRSKKVKERGDLEEEFGLGFKPNEGEAAQHGVFYDDTQYDYMQHMRDLGGAEGPVTWVDSSAPVEKGKGKMKLEDALRDMDIDSPRRSVAGSRAGESVASSIARSLLPEEVLPSEYVTRRTYQDQQDVPDEIAGFQPDVDPRLREVLEALEDEEYVDDEEDIFGELTQDGYEVDRDEWDRLGEQQVFDDDDEGWESDHTIRAASPSPAVQPAAFIASEEPAAPPEDTQAVPPADPTSGAWLDEFKKFKQSTKPDSAFKLNPAQPTPSALDASVLSSLASGRHKKRKGAKTSTTNYSMTSSALQRTGLQSTLDSRFDKILEKEDMLDDLAEEDEGSQLPDTASFASGLTGMSKSSRISRYSTTSGMSGVSGISSYSRATDSEAPQLERTDFNGIMDEFLGGHSKAGKGGKKIKRFGPQSGMEQLDEVRKGLGPAILGPKSRQSVI
ncbi:Protein ltv1 [Elasticomyces elasticus]|nr:Protein ltv1 [Elasticomyces elasticus]